ncbi:helix-turn-helix domain-containing protein [Amycolatopsis anabasis]|uniref:helix-turn-helix domain-containing protein n=1 Tax=Amycolatopsis anabasis TaxID=1840409 RepID=UPI00131D5D31|nr:helix-turn-helix transcriptional regulator [Amycolatopsis anabasis]
MRTGEKLASRPEFTVTAVTCRDDHAGWSAAEARGSHGLVLVRRGRFRHRAAGVESDVDPTVAYLSSPGVAERFAHPAGGDVCTSVTFPPRLWRALAGDDTRPARPAVYVDARLDLAHRRLLRAGADVDYALAEELLGLLAQALGQVVTGPTPLADRISAADRAHVAAARQAIAEDDPVSRGLFPLAEALGVSPYRLSRAFTRELGVSLTRYRNRVRIGRALDRLEQGEPSLAALAADLGFADQAHLTRTVRTHVGYPPRAVRGLLDPTIGPCAAG